MQSDRDGENGMKEPANAMSRLVLPRQEFRQKV